MQKYKLVLVEGSDDEYKVYTDKRASMLCGEQWDEFVKVADLEIAIEGCEGDLDFLKFKLGIG